jgi:hypothetical protein
VTAAHEHCPGCACCSAAPIEAEREASALVRDGERQRTYGHPREDFTRTAAMWSAILGVHVTTEKALLCMAALKISRLCQTPDHRDSLVDLIGYGIAYDRVVNGDPE